ncbi:DUF6714 family protein [Acaryochloris sp. IP29b_bin.137]|uniref:DUF6714 family protein n=1 Tax=Acaryochloris sp. IP29b_bin.137 TaxID=2969217 RepID=UPI0026195EAB|nr:DUF6714 family protein [Acaryochloris sp. IP29b_bin.137]
MDKDIVANNIKSAFAGVTLGAGIGLWEAQAIDDYKTQEVQRRNREKDEKEEWHRLNCDDLQRCHSSLSFFDAEGMRFHLPAYIVASLENKVDDPLFHLTQLDDYAKSKLTTLNPLQRQAIVMYLEWCLEQEEYAFDHPTIRMALREYWTT